MNMRKIASLTALVAFVFLLLTSVILYIVPSGRVAYWSGWRLWSLSKEDWGAVHINLGVLLLIAILLHVYYNWKPLLSYLKSRTRQMRIFTADFNISLILTLVVFFGTLAGIPPLSSIIELGAAITDRANLQYGEPPYGHAELSPLQDFAEKAKVDLAEGLAKIEAAGIKVENPQQTLEQIAQANGISPKEIYAAMSPAPVQAADEMPEQAPGGSGNRTLAQICELYQLNPADIVQALTAKGLQVELGQTLKEIARANSIDPQAVYADIYAAARR